MSRKYAGKRVFFAEIDGKLVTIGAVLPNPPHKLRIIPSSHADSAAKGPKGVFRNGRG